MVCSSFPQCSTLSKQRYSHDDAVGPVKGTIKCRSGAPTHRRIARIQRTHYNQISAYPALSSECASNYIFGSSCWRAGLLVSDVRLK